MAKIKEKEDSRVAFLLNELEGKKRVLNGNVSFDGWALTQHRVYISRLLDFKSHIPEVDRRKLVISAINSAASSGILNNKSFTDELNRKERKYNEITDGKFRLITQISIDPGLVVKRQRSLECWISFNIDQSSKAYKEYIKVLAHVKNLQVPDMPIGYTTVSVSCTAKTTASAFQRCDRALNFWRGCHNLGINRVRKLRFSFDRRSPVNTILLHPVSTIHHANGQLVDTSWYFDSSYYASSKVLSEPDNINIGKNYFDVIRKIMTQHTYSNVVIDSIARYSRLLDMTDWESSYIQLWSICEALTLTTSSDNSQTIKRMKSIYKNKEYLDVTLQVLKDYRNSAGHFGEESQDIEVLLFNLKTVVEDLICFHAVNRFKFASLRQAVDCLELGSDVDHLEERVELFTKAISKSRWLET